MCTVSAFLPRRAGEIVPQPRCVDKLGVVPPTRPIGDQPRCLMPRGFNHRPNAVFVDRDDPGEALRAFSPTEVRLVTLLLQMFTSHSKAEDSTTFELGQLMEVIARESEAGIRKYLRPTIELLERLRVAGVLAEVPSAAGGSAVMHRRFRGTWQPTAREWGVGLGALAYGLPFVARVYETVVVRIHVTTTDGDPGIASGIVIGKDTILTCSHVVAENELVGVSWNTPDPHPATVALKGRPGTDMAVLDAEGFGADPYPWMRSPRAAEEVVVLAYPSIANVVERPLLRFVGHVSTRDHVEARGVGEQSILTAVMNPGASGGAVFSADGHLVGMVTTQLQGDYQNEGISISHAATPADVLQRELRVMEPERFRYLNEFAPGTG